MKYTDPSGEFIWIIPNISWSKSGGLSIGVSLVFGIPGIASVQVGGGYNFKSGDPFAYAGASAMFNTVSLSGSPSGGWNAGYTVGASPFSGLPISTNFATVGASYNITHNSWSGNVSAWSVSQNGWDFNPSVSAMIYPEHTTNFVRRGKFVSNDKMLKEFGDDYAGALKYFGFKGTYTGTTKGSYNVDGGGEGASFYGSTNPRTGSIEYGDLAFDSYDILKMTYTKEVYHSLRVKNGIPLESQGTELGKHLKYYPEERLGFIHAYKNQGLYPSAGKGLMSNISYYQMQSFNLNPSQYYSAKWWHFIYKIPRKW